MAPVCGIPAETIREVARLYAKSKGSMILWGMGISQHVHGTDNARCLIALCMMTGQIGRPGTGPASAARAEQRAGRVRLGADPDGVSRTTSASTMRTRTRASKNCGAPTLDPKPGLTVVEIMDAVHEGKIRGMYIMGENPAMSDPDAHHAREALAKLDCLVVQEIFLTETCYHADVILPATAWPEKSGTVTNTDRMVQLGRQALDAPGEAKPDLWIIQEIARRMGLDWNYQGTARRVQRNAPRHGFHRRHHLGAAGAGKLRDLSVREGGRSRASRLFSSRNFRRPPGAPSSCRRTSFPPPSSPDKEFPFVLITGRQLEHWHTGAMTRRASVLDAIEPEPIASVHPLDLDAIGAKPGDVITVESRRGIISLYARADDGTPRGAVFIPFCYYEAAANLLTNPVLDPFGKIPEFKYCAVKVMKGGELTPRSSYGGGQALAALGKA